MVLRSYPGHENLLKSSRIIQDLSESNPRWLFTFAGISMAKSGLAGGVCVIGATVAFLLSSSFLTTRMIAQGLFRSLNLQLFQLRIHSSIN
jgi:hypothetical protein